MTMHRGLWWSPEAPEHKLAGTLTLGRRTGVGLDLVVPADEPPASSLAARLRWPNQIKGGANGGIVHGESKRGRRYTLFDGWVANTIRHSSGVVNGASMRFNRGYRGEHIAEPDELRVSSVFMRLPGLGAWLDDRSFQFEYDDACRRVVITHTVPSARTWRIDECRQLMLAWSRRGPCDSWPQSKVEVVAVPWIGVTYQQPQVVSDVHEEVSAVGQLLSLFLGAPTTARVVEFESPSHQIEFEGATTPRRIRHLATHFRLPEPVERWHTSDVLIPFSKIETELESYLAKWFELRRDCWGVIVPYFASQRSPAPLAESRFFDAASTAESLPAHLRKHERLFPDSEAKRIRKAAASAVEESRREAVRSALGRINHPSYVDWLKSLMGRFPSLVEAVVGDPDAQRRFRQRVRDLRNMEAHRLPRDQPDPTGLELVRITAKLRPIIDAWILAEVGIDEHRIVDAMRRNRRYWHYASHETWPWAIA